MDLRSRTRPSLAPIWTDRGRADKTAYRGAGPGRSSFPLPRSPRTLPSPMVTSAAAQDSPMRKYERAMVQSLDQPTGRSPLSATDGPTPIDEEKQHSATARRRSLHPPTPPTRSPRPLAPATPRQTLADESRAVLLTGIPPAQLRGLGVVYVDQRRHSLPDAPSAGAIAAAARRSSLATREHVRPLSERLADCFVVATALRRPSEASSSGDEDIKAEAVSVSESPESDRLTVRVRVRPQTSERKPFVLQRTFDLAELRATVPFGRRTSLDLLPSPSWTMSSPLGNGGGRRQQGRNGVGFEAQKALPIHLSYARMRLPVLAALMLSGHVHSGDIIDLPMPHPGAWPQTVAYVYSGQCELTEAIGENIRYLAGKV